MTVTSFFSYKSKLISKGSFQVENAFIIYTFHIKFHQKIPLTRRDLKEIKLLAIAYLRNHDF